MTGIEQLKLAAKARGYEVARVADDGESLLLVGIQEPWNPRKYSRDAFDLADHLHLMLDMDETRIRVIYGPMTRVVEIKYGAHDRMQVNRLAIVTIAAEIGEAM